MLDHVTQRELSIFNVLASLGIPGIDSWLTKQTTDPFQIENSSCDHFVEICIYAKDLC